jgi:hypothetical protein
MMIHQSFRSNEPVAGHKSQPCSNYIDLNIILMQAVEPGEVLPQTKNLAGSCVRDIVYSRNHLFAKAPEFNSDCASKSGGVPILV